MSRKNPGRMVKLKDGRVGHVFNTDAQQPVNGKVAVYTYDTIKQADLFNPESDLSELKSVGKKIMCDPKGLKVIGFFD